MNVSNHDATLLRRIMAKQPISELRTENPILGALLKEYNPATDDGYERIATIINQDTELMTQVMKADPLAEPKEPMSLDTLDLSKRVLKALDKAGHKSVDDVLDVLTNEGRAGLKSIPGIGNSSIEDILFALEDRGIDIPDMPEDDYDDKPPTPDDDQLADIVVAEIEDDYRFFRSAYHKYDTGIWCEQKNIYPHIITVLRENRRLGVRPSRARYTSVDFFCERALELEDDTTVDNYPEYFNVQNGLFNLDTMELEPHTKDVYITAQAGFEYDPKATCPTFQNWLCEMLVHAGTDKPDFQLIHLVQEMIGYCLTADTSHRVSFWIIGPSGSGKSTLVNNMVAMMKSYHTTVDLNQLATNRFLLARIAGKRLVTSVEASAGVKLDDGIYKTLVSDDVILADVKNREPIEFVPQCKIVWAMNNLPYVHDRSGAVDSRVKIIPMSRQVPRDEWDTQLDEKFLSELPGIFNFALEGLQRLRTKGAFTTVEQSEKLGDEYRRMQDIYAAFLEDEEWCILGNGKEEPTPLYKAFSAWCYEAGIRHFASKISISREWERLGLNKYRSESRRYYSGITLTNRAKNAFA